jgi:hypothetical protein
MKMTVFRVILKYVWLAVFFLCVIVGVHSSIKRGISDSYVFFIFALISFGFFWLRRKPAERENQ